MQQRNNHRYSRKKSLNKIHKSADRLKTRTTLSPHCPLCPSLAFHPSPNTITFYTHRKSAVPPRSPILPFRRIQLHTVPYTESVHQPRDTRGFYLAVSVFPERWNSKEDSPRRFASRVGVARGLWYHIERERESSPPPLPSHNATPWPVVHGNRSRPRRVRGEAAPCIVSCPRDRRTSRHSCQRLAHESFHHIEWKRASFLVYIIHVRVGNELYDKAVARGGSSFFFFFCRAIPGLSRGRRVLETWIVSWNGRGRRVLGVSATGGVSMNGLEAPGLRNDVGCCRCALDRPRAPFPDRNSFLFVLEHEGTDVNLYETVKCRLNPSSPDRDFLRKIVSSIWNIDFPNMSKYICWFTYHVTLHYFSIPILVPGN